MHNSEIYTSSFSNAPNTPVILSAPHGGRLFTRPFLETSPLSELKLLATADIGTDELVAEFGVPYIAARFARSFVDLNRARNQLDPFVIRDVPPSNEPQIIAGYGVIPRYAERGHLIHASKISYEDAQKRLIQYYDPYHEQLRAMCGVILGKFGLAILIDVHSAPTAVLRDIDIQFGTQYGRTMPSALVAGIDDCFRNAGLRTAHNYPFAGGYITQNYASLGIHTIQIEINRALIGQPKFRAKWVTAMCQVFSKFSDPLDCAAE